MVKAILKKYNKIKIISYLASGMISAVIWIIRPQLSSVILIVGISFILGKLVRVLLKNK